MATRVFRGQRMAKDWGFIPGFSSNLTGNNVVAGAGFVPGASATVLRMICEYIVVPSPGGTFAVADEVVISLGIGVVSSDAFVAGGASMPDPGSDLGFPWLWTLSHKLLLGAVTHDFAAIGGNVRHSFDVRSMRKMKADQTLAFVVEYTDVAGTPPITVSTGRVRVLVGGL